VTIASDVTEVGELVRLERTRPASSLRGNSFGDPSLGMVAKIGAGAAVVVLVLILGLVLALREKKKGSNQNADSVASAAVPSTSSVQPVNSLTSTNIAAVAPTSNVSVEPSRQSDEPANTTPHTWLTPSSRPQHPFDTGSNEKLVFSESFEDSGSGRMWEPVAKNDMVGSMVVHDGMAVAPPDATTPRVAYIRKIPGSMDILDGPVHIYWRLYMPDESGRKPNSIQLSAAPWSLNIRPRQSIEASIATRSPRHVSYEIPMGAIASEQVRQLLTSPQQPWLDLRLDILMAPRGMASYALSAYIDTHRSWEPISLSSSSAQAEGAPQSLLMPANTIISMLMIQMDASPAYAGAGIEAVLITQEARPDNAQEQPPMQTNQQDPAQRPDAGQLPPRRPDRRPGMPPPRPIRPRGEF